MNYEGLLTNANLAFSSNQFDIALKTAQEAIKMGKSKPDGYVCAGKAALSLGDTQMALQQ